MFTETWNWAGTSKKCKSSLLLVKVENECVIAVCYEWEHDWLTHPCSELLREHGTFHSLYGHSGFSILIWVQSLKSEICTTDISSFLRLSLHILHPRYAQTYGSHQACTIYLKPSCISWHAALSLSPYGRELRYICWSTPKRVATDITNAISCFCQHMNHELIQRYGSRTV